jgi:hypothetical protein
MPPVTSMQRLTINQFVGLTGLPEKTAIKVSSRLVTPRLGQLSDG